jgi:hypothetical protein
MRPGVQTRLRFRLSNARAGRHSRTAFAPVRTMRRSSAEANAARMAAPARSGLASPFAATGRAASGNAMAKSFAVRMAVNTAHQRVSAVPRDRPAVTIPTSGWDVFLAPNAAAIPIARCHLHAIQPPAIRATSALQDSIAPLIRRRAAPMVRYVAVLANVATRAAIFYRPAVSMSASSNVHVQIRGTFAPGKPVLRHAQRRDFRAEIATIAGV